jgi:hypothetical protein
VHQHPADALLDREGLEQRLALAGVQVDVARHQVGEAARLVHPVEDLLHHLLGEARLLAQFRGPRTDLAVQRDERRILGVHRRQLLGVPDDGLEPPALVLRVVHRDGAAVAVHQELHPGEAPLDLPDAGDGPDGMEGGGVHPLGVLPLGDGKDQLVLGLERRLEGAEGPGAAGADRRGDPGEEHDLPEGEDGKRQAFRHRLSPRPPAGRAEWQSWHVIGHREAPAVPVPSTPRYASGGGLVRTAGVNGRLAEGLPVTSCQCGVKRSRNSAGRGTVVMVQIAPLPKSLPRAKKERKFRCYRPFTLS